MAKERVRVYVHFDVEQEVQDSGSMTSSIAMATSDVQNQLNMMPRYSNSKLAIFGATLLPYETVVLPREGAQVIKVQEHIRG